MSRTGAMGCGKGLGRIGVVGAPIGDAVPRGGCTGCGAGVGRGTGAGVGVMGAFVPVVGVGCGATGRSVEEPATVG